jgi:hypothetical protein
MNLTHSIHRHRRRRRRRRRRRHGRAFCHSSHHSATEMSTSVALSTSRVRLMAATNVIRLRITAGTATGTRKILQDRGFNLISKIHRFV